MPTFTPPTVRQPVDAHHPLLKRYSIDVGQSVVKKNGVFTLTPFPWIGDLEGLAEGTDYFMGGRTYAITVPIGVALQSAGFSLGDDPTTDDYSYGRAPYGLGPYGG